jgi:hypothetical protein
MARLTRRLRLIASLIALAAVVALVATLAEREDGGTASGRAWTAGVSGRWHPTIDPPIDPRQAQLRFGQRSHWLQPWRSYLDTLPARKLRSALGINFDVFSYVGPAARVLAQAGIRRARIELSWNMMSFERPDRMGAHHAPLMRVRLHALRRNGIRPLILLNSNAGDPCPARPFSARLAQPARRGDRTLVVDEATAARVVAGRSGIDQPRMQAGILFSGVSGNVVQLAAPLSADLAAGDHPAHELRYAPFAPPRLPDGSPNPEFERTYAGWAAYVRGAMGFVRRQLGGARFDVEIWNELSFGSAFLSQRNYYSPPPPNSRGEDAAPTLLTRTVALLRDPARGLRGVGITNGFASQRPWDAAAITPPGLTALSKHPYRGATRFPEQAKIDTIAPLDARGREDFVAEPLPGGDRLARDRFIPRYRAFFPEYYLTAIQTETLIRDLSPRTSEIYGVPHGRRAAPRGRRPVAVWITEIGMDPSGLDPSTPRVGARPRSGLTRRDVIRLQAKAALRTYVSYVGKGAGAVYVYATRDKPFGLIPRSFFAATERGRRPGMSAAGPALRAIARLSRALRSSRPLNRRRPLRLEQVADTDRRVQFRGDGTAAHPDLHDRDVLAFQPFQLDDHAWIAPVYVMTRDLATLYRPHVSPRDPRRYDMPEAPFRLRIGGLDGCAASASLRDPLTGAARPVRVLSRSPRSLTVVVAATDYPRLLALRERRAPRAGGC